MKEYQNALDDMSNEAVEYVRGIPVVKTFGQTIFPLRSLGFNRPVQGVGDCLHQAAAHAYDVLYRSINGVLSF